MPQENTHCTKFQYISSFVQYSKHIVSYQSVSKALYTATIKLKVKEQTLRYAKTRKAEMLREEEELEKKINILQRQIDSGCNNANEKLAIDIQLDQKTKELEKINEHRTKGAMLRAKCKLFNEGEKKFKAFPKS